MIMRATQKNRISGAVTSIVGRIERVRDPVDFSFGPAERRERPEPRREPGVEHVLVLPHRRRRTCGHVATSSRLTMTLLGASHSSQYHTGMRWPHQSCREMFQSRMFSSQLTYTASQRSGRMRIAPSRTASSAGLGERLHLHEPLVGQARLDHRVAAVAVPHRVLCAARPSRARPTRLEHLRRSARAPRTGRARAARRARGRPRRAPRP